MRPPARTTRSSRRLSDAQDTPSPVRRPANSKIAPKPASRSAFKPDAARTEKKPRHRMTDKQLERLEALYQQDTHPTREQKQALGVEVGMDTRTVTVWFQNRRQLAKKQSLILGSTPQPMCRQPLRIVSQVNSKATSRQPSVSTTSEPSAPQTPLFCSSRQQTRRLDLWEHLPSSPATNITVSAATSAMPSPLAKRFTNMFGPPREENKENYQNKKRKTILEWACARVAKRQRMQPVAEDDEGTEDDSDVDVTLVDLENQDDVKLVVGKSSDIAFGKKTAEPTTKRKIVSIPQEYAENFDPDVILGASLLLSLQQSYKSCAVSVPDKGTD